MRLSNLATGQGKWLYQPRRNPNQTHILLWKFYLLSATSKGPALPLRLSQENGQQSRRHVTAYQYLQSHHEGSTSCPDSSTASKDYISSTSASILKKLIRRIKIGAPIGWAADASHGDIYPWDSMQPLVRIAHPRAAVKM